MLSFAKFPRSVSGEQTWAEAVKRELCEVLLIILLIELRLIIPSKIALLTRYKRLLKDRAFARS